MSEKEQSIHPDTSIGIISLLVPNLDRSLDFYQRVLGMTIHTQDEYVARLGAAVDQALLELIADPQATAPGRRAPGLYHFAIRLPSRQALARALVHLARSGWPMQGASDHLVSEALYLADPDGNGIEIYSDRPKAEWPYRDNQLQMATEALDVDSLMSELDQEGREGPWSGLDAATEMGHVHLKVSNIPAAEAFYTNLLGFDLVTRYGSFASFVSAGGYHHHIGFNTWTSAGAPPPPSGALGLRFFEVRLPGREALQQVVSRLQAAGVVTEPEMDGFLVRDPSQNGVLLRANS